MNSDDVLKPASVRSLLLTDAGFFVNTSGDALWLFSICRSNNKNFVYLNVDNLAAHSV